MKAINYYLIIDKVKEPPKKIAGLELTEEQNKEVRYLKGEVVSAGNLVEGVKDGDLISYDKHAGHGIEFENKLYYIIKIGDIVIVH
jgi:co-chaperonin GroES (HSP10)